MYLKIFMFVDLLLVADIMCAKEFKVKSLEIGASGKIPCDHSANDPEVLKVRQVQWYKSRRSDEFVNGDLSLAWWTERESGSLLNYHMENTTFSLVIGNATLEDEGLYKCFVVRGDLFTESNYFIRTVMYALPRKDPVITLDTDLNRVYCTVEQVRPMIYPVFDFDWSPDSTEPNAVLHEDGTYTTWVSCTLPKTRSASRVHCSFSYFHYQGVGSLDLRNIATDFLTERTTNAVSPMGTSVTCAGDGCTTICHMESTYATIIIVLVTIVIILIIVMFPMLTRKCYRGAQNCNKDKASEEIMIRPE